MRINVRFRRLALLAAVPATLAALAPAADNDPCAEDRLQMVQTIEAHARTATDALGRSRVRRRRSIAEDLLRVDPLEQRRRVTGVEVLAEVDVPQRRVRDSRRLVANAPGFDCVVQEVGLARVGGAGSSRIVVEDLQRLDQRQAT